MCRSKAERDGADGADARDWWSGLLSSCDNDDLHCIHYIINL